MENLNFEEVLEINGGYLNPSPGINSLGLLSLGASFVLGFFAGTDIF